MDKQLANQILAEKLDAMLKLLRECEAISEESGVGFFLPWGGEGTEEVGMGAYYSPAGDEDEYGYCGEDLYKGWNSSAGTC